MGNDTRCTIEGCERPQVARSWCGRHYQRWRNHGDPLFTKLPMKVDGTPEERFWPKVDADGICWEWMAAKDTKGYGVFNPNGVLVRAHRFAWENLVGQIPEGLELDHLCRVRHCVNPDHLEPVTHQINAIRGASRALRSAQAARQTHCKREHEFTSENTYVSKNNERVCRTCHRERARQRREDKR